MIEESKIRILRDSIKKRNEEQIGLMPGWVPTTPLERISFEVGREFALSWVLEEMEPQ